MAIILNQTLTHLCPMCTRDVEHVLHIFFDCEYAQRCWELAGLIFDMQKVESAAVATGQASQESNNNLLTVTRVLRGIKKFRTRKYWRQI